MTSPRVETIDPKIARRRDLHLKAPVFDDKAVARADLALEVMSDEFRAWLDEEVARIQDARKACAAASWSDPSLEQLNALAHDLKGLGATFGYPLITEICASLCRLIETPQGKTAARANPELAEAHIDAVRAAARDNITSSDHPVGGALINALTARVDALGVAPR